MLTATVEILYCSVERKSFFWDSSPSQIIPKLMIECSYYRVIF